MSRTLSPSYQKPAAVLALIVHGGFFALLYFGFTWQTHAPEAMSVELWQALPDMTPQPVVVTPPAPPELKIEPVPPVISPVVEVKPDIVLAIKKPEKKITETKAAPVIEQPKTRTPAKPAPPSIADLAAARELAAQAEQAAAVKGIMDEAMSKISSKIRRNIVMPPDVANDAQAVFAVTLLPGGTVLNARLVQSSGNVAYDNAVERAILKSQPLPLPADTSLFNRFRELKLKFKPVE